MLRPHGRHNKNKRCHVSAVLTFDRCHYRGNDQSDLLYEHVTDVILLPTNNKCKPLLDCGVCFFISMSRLLFRNRTHSSPHVLLRLTCVIIIMIIITTLLFSFPFPYTVCYNTLLHNNVIYIVFLILFLQ